MVRRFRSEKCFYCALSVMTIATVLLWYKFSSTTHTAILADTTKHVETQQAAVEVLKNLPDVKFILLWTDPTTDPMMHLGVGMETFVKRKCEVFNCFVSTDRKFFEDVRKFDLVIFHAKDVSSTRKPEFPTARSPHQKYVVASTESSDYYPLCDKKYNNYFNWTWTYKLDSDEIYGYIIVKNKTGEVIGPTTDMHWMNIESMEPISDEVKSKLSTKKTAAAWFVSNCNARSNRLQLARQLQNELRKHRLVLDIYGSCGTKRCPPKQMDNCFHLIEKDYYFYLSYENSYSEDYVTEKLLTALKHYAVPIVYGAANYTRFMPDGIYLDAKKHNPKDLAKLMADAINNKEVYYNYFKWHNHYSYHDIEEFPYTDSYCKLCALANNKEEFSRTYSHEDFTSWWNPPNRCK